MNKELEEALQIRYVKLHFTIVLLENSVLPKYKASALRGGIGEMLLRANCVRDRECEKCDFESECMVQRTMYSKFDIKPEFVTTGESVGYVLECENYQEEFEAGEQIQFQLLLFGKTIVYFNQYMQALYALGMQGIGKNHSRFQIVSVTNTRKEPILDGNNIYMKNYEIQMVSDYVVYRLQQIEREGLENTVYFKTPLTLRYHNEYLQEFHVQAMINAVKRRIYMLECFEGKISELYSKKYENIPEILQQEHYFIGVPRYSTRHGGKMTLKGIEGRMQITEMEPEILELLLAGELLHIGKNTSFGFGRYRIK